MHHNLRSTVFLVVVIICSVLSITIAHGAAGGIEGKVSDPKGRVVAGANVTATETATKQIFKAITDDQGLYKLQGMPAGTYSLLITAKGFKDFTQTAVVAENTPVVVNANLEVTSVQASVEVPTGNRANSDAIYQSLRNQARGEQDFSGPYATVNNLVLQREGAKFTLRSGEIYFLPAVDGRYTGAVFMGDGELLLVPPTQIERNSLKLFTDEPTLTEQFTNLVL
ncbi:MAG TPA: carboxypeptidase-like regulatory domain-containing protein, partial [Pyrinomonadaceae bacterium]